MHFYASIEKQAAGTSRCELCAPSPGRRAIGPCNPEGDLQGHDVDVFFTGSPCNPFSSQRSKRYSTGDVVNHPLYSITSSEVVKLLLRFEPKKILLEQVWGFAQPFEKGGSETPKDKPLGLGPRVCSALFNCFLSFLSGLASRFLQSLGEQPWQKGGYFVVTHKMESSLFINMHRKRRAWASSSHLHFLPGSHDQTQESRAKSKVRSSQERGSRHIV